MSPPAIIEEIPEISYRPMLRERFAQMAALLTHEAVLQTLEIAESAEPGVRLNIYQVPDEAAGAGLLVAG